MTKSEIKDSIKTILVSILKHDKISMDDDMTAADVRGWDSLSHMIIIKDIESHFSVKFKLRDLNKIVNMASLVSMIESKLGS